MKKINILNVGIHNITLDELLFNLKKGMIVTPNVDHLVRLQKDKEFYQAYEVSDFIICDSKIVQFASIFLGTPIIEKISGSDFFPAFYKHHKNNKEIKIFLLGAMENVAERAAKKINDYVGRKIIVDYRSPSYGFENNKSECMEIIEHINNSDATVLAVGVGAPKQEKWLLKYKSKMPNIKIFMAIGATIDFEAGNVKRAPKLVSRVGIEWLYRLLLEPKRLWKRYLVDGLIFPYLVIKQRFGFYKNPMDYLK